MSAIDYDKLVRSINTSLQSKSLSNRFLQPSHIVLGADTNLIVGGFGDVQQAFYCLPGQRSYKIALKKLRPQGDWSQRVLVIAALVRELRVWGDLQHRNILRLGGFYYDVDTLDCAWIVTLWQENGNVSDYIAKTKTDADGRLKLARDTAQGLAYLHSRQPPVCHADIKPENTLVNREGNAMLCDFGLSRILDNESSGLTTTSTPKITLWYTSPEILNNNSHHTLASDVWAWGCLLLHIITGLRPYAAYNATSVVLAIATGKSPANLDIIDLRDFIASLLVLAYETTNLFNAYCELEYEELDDIPPEYRTKSEDWLAIRNPSSGKVYEFDFVLSTADERQLSFALSTDNRTIAVFNGTDVVKYYDVESGQQRSETDYHAKLTGPEDSQDTGVSAICFGHLGSLLATGHGNGAVAIWNFPAQTLVHLLKGHKASIDTVAFVHRDTIMVSQSYDDSIFTWDVERGARLHKFDVTDTWGVISSPRHPIIIVLNRGDSTILCDAQLGGCARLSECYSEAVFFPDGSKLICGYGHESLAVWDLQLLLDERKRRLNAGVPLSDVDDLVFHVTSLDKPRSFIVSLSLSSDGQLCALGSEDPDQLVLWDLAAGQAVMQMRGRRVGSADKIAFRPGSTVSQGTLAYLGDWGKTLQLGLLHEVTALENRSPIVVACSHMPILIAFSSSIVEPHRPASFVGDSEVNH